MQQYIGKYLGVENLKCVFLLELQGGQMRERGDEVRSKERGSKNASAFG
jgi:hypothetical protein